MKLYTSISTRYIHFVFFFFASICEVTTTSDNFTPSIYFYHCFGAHSSRTFIGKNKFVSFFQSKPTMSCLSLYNC